MRSWLAAIGAGAVVISAAHFMGIIPLARHTMQIPRSRDSLVLRTDFSDESAWQAVCAAIEKPVGQFRAHVEFCSDLRNDGLTVEQIVLLCPKGSHHAYLFVVDHVALTHPERPILVVDLYETPGRTFRVVPSEMWGVENNLFLANMDFSEFADSADRDGVFRGFKKP